MVLVDKCMRIYIFHVFPWQPWLGPGVWRLPLPGRARPFPAFESLEARARGARLALVLTDPQRMLALPSRPCLKRCYSASGSTCMSTFSLYGIELFH